VEQHALLNGRQRIRFDVHHRLFFAERAVKESRNAAFARSKAKVILDLRNNAFFRTVQFLQAKQELWFLGIEMARGLKGAAKPGSLPYTLKAFLDVCKRKTRGKIESWPQRYHHKEVLARYYPLMSRSQPARRIELAGSDIHVWPVILRGDEDVVLKFAGLLAPSEANRADGFLFEHLSRSFVLSHGVLRVLTGHYLKTDPSIIRFVFGPKGKPAVSPRTSLQFNMSHSGDMALFAFTNGCEVGVDIEQMRPIRDLQDVATHFFSSSEAAELAAMPPDYRTGAFFACWTRKEAYIKAIGDGLSTPLDSFRVSLRPGEPAQFVSVNDDKDQAAAWSLHDLAVTPGFAGALAYRDAPRRVLVLPVVSAGEVLDLRLQAAADLAGG
jgi:4'-phosphopantetheinyl transferase